jgi:hypothetical protein
MGELRQHVRKELADPDGVVAIGPGSFPKKGTEPCGAARSGAAGSDVGRRSVLRSARTAREVAPPSESPGYPVACVSQVLPGGPLLPSQNSRDMDRWPRRIRLISPASASRPSPDRVSPAPGIFPAHRGAL